MLAIRLLLATALLAAGAAQPAAAQLYKWVDENGKLHFSDVPPPSGKGTKIQGSQEPQQSERPRATDYAGRYTGPEPSRQIVLEKIAIQLDSPSDQPRVIGSGCYRRPVTVYHAKGEARQVNWQSGFHGRLEELGYQTPASVLTFAREAPRPPELSVMGVITDMRVEGCRVVSSLEVEWRVFDNLRREVVLETTTRGADRLRGNGRLGHSMLEAFVSAANEMFKSRGFGELMVPAAASLADAAPAELDAMKLAVRFGAGASTFSARVGELKAGTVTVRTAGGHGSGFLVSTGGHVLTNAHVVAGSERVIVILGDEERDARVLRRDAVRDVALLQLEGFADAPPLELARTAPREGDTLYVIGTPLDERLSHTVTRGILSSVRELDGQRFYQTDAAINKGNSGGPVLNEQGEVVAITVAGVFSQGGAPMDINLLIPLHDAFDALALETR